MHEVLDSVKLNERNMWSCWHKLNTCSIVYLYVLTSCFIFREIVQVRHVGEQLADIVLLAEVDANTRLALLPLTFQYTLPLRLDIEGLHWLRHHANRDTTTFERREHYELALNNLIAMNWQVQNTLTET